MSVIISRALPDVRDGLKPSQRRILFAMNDLALMPERKHIKCAKICGEHAAITIRTVKRRFIRPRSHGPALGDAREAG